MWTADHASVRNEDFVKIPLGLTVNFYNPFLLLIVERDLLDGGVKLKMWVQVEVVGEACQILVYLNAGGV
jgi:hypothetical protein